MRKLMFGLLAVALSFGTVACSQAVQAPATHHHVAVHAKPMGHVEVTVFDPLGAPKAHRDLGYGVVTNFGTMSLANDAFWAGPSGAPINTLTLEKYCATGTGATAAAQTDVTLQTADAVTPVAGTISNVSTANTEKEQVVCTLAYSGTEAVTEWGLFNNGTLSATTGTPWTAGAATTGTATGTPYTASSTTVQGEQEFVFSDTTKSPAICGLAFSNTTSVITVPAWYKCTDNTASGTFPANADALKIYPVMIDHQVFSALNVVSGDSIQFTFTLTFPSNG